MYNPRLSLALASWILHKNRLARTQPQRSHRMILGTTRNQVYQEKRPFRCVSRLSLRLLKHQMSRSARGRSHEVKVGKHNNSGRKWWTHSTGREPFRSFPSLFHLFDVYRSRRTGPFLTSGRNTRQGRLRQAESSCTSFRLGSILERERLSNDTSTGSHDLPGYTSAVRVCALGDAFTPLETGAAFGLTSTRGMLKRAARRLRLSSSSSLITPAAPTDDVAGFEADGSCAAALCF